MIESNKKDVPPVERNPHRDRILLVEPDRLTRWSVHEYLKDRFDLTLTENADLALKLLAFKTYDAIVLADDLPANGADRIENFIRKRDKQLLIVRTTATQVRDMRRGLRKVFLEKPFELSALANFLSNCAKANEEDVNG